MAPRRTAGSCPAGAPHPRPTGLNRSPCTSWHRPFSHARADRGRRPVRLQEPLQESPPDPDRGVALRDRAGAVDLDPGHRPDRFDRLGDKGRITQGVVDEAELAAVGPNRDRSLLNAIVQRSACGRPRARIRSTIEFRPTIPSCAQMKAIRGRAGPRSTTRAAGGCLLDRGGQGAWTTIVPVMPG